MGVRAWLACLAWLAWLAAAAHGSPLTVYQRVNFQPDPTWDDPTYSLGWPGCVQLCRNLRCHFWSFAPKENLCTPHFQLPSVPSSPDPDLLHYALAVPPGREYVVLFGVGETQNWQEAKALCEHYGGKLGYINDVLETKKIRDSYGVTGLFIGLSRDPLDTDPFIDQEGNSYDQSVIPFSPDEPTLGADQRCTSFWGSVNDIRCDRQGTEPALCKMP